jgi:hypothetical protein
MTILTVCGSLDTMDMDGQEVLVEQVLLTPRVVSRLAVRNPSIPPVGKRKQIPPAEELGGMSRDG